MYFHKSHPIISVFDINVVIANAWKQEIANGSNNFINRYKVNTDNNNRMQYTIDE